MDSSSVISVPSAPMLVVKKTVVIILIHQPDYKDPLYYDLLGVKILRSVFLEQPNPHTLLLSSEWSLEEQPMNVPHQEGLCFKLEICNEHLSTPYYLPLAAISRVSIIKNLIAKKPRA
jgi:hypothetical protein